MVFPYLSEGSVKRKILHLSMEDTLMFFEFIQDQLEPNTSSRFPRTQDKKMIVS